MPPPKLKKKLGHVIVHIIVGPETQDFGVHKDLICHHSPFFRAAFNSGFEETKTGVMKLSDDTDAKTFQLFYDWLYTQTLWDKDEPKEEWPTLTSLVKLYVFADMTKIPQLKNQCLDTYEEISAITKTVLVKPLPYIWQNTVPSDPLRLFIVDIIVRRSKPSLFSSRSHLFSNEIGIAIMTAMRDHIIELHKAFDKDKKPKDPLDDMKKYHTVDTADAT